MVIDEGKGLSTEDQQYDPTSTINVLRREVDIWRASPEAQWNVTPETARLLKHWREYDFSDIRPFFCQVEAVETAIWLTEVAPQSGRREVREILERLDDVNEQANPDLARLAIQSAPTGSSRSRPSRPRLAKSAGYSPIGTPISEMSSMTGFALRAPHRRR